MKISLQKPAPVAVVILLLLIGKSVAQHQLLPNVYHDFVLFETPRIPGVTSESQMDALNENSVTRSITYFDAIGRVMQETQVGITPGHNDFVIAHDYQHNNQHTYGRYPREDLIFKKNTYLPFTGNYQGDFVWQGIQEALDYYDPAVDCTPNGAIACDEKPYATTLYERSPRRLPLQQLGVGTDWADNTQYTLRVALTAGEIIPVFELDASGRPVYAGRDYPAGSLFVEDNFSHPYGPGATQNVTRTYTDKSGRTIATKVKAVENPSSYTDTEDYHHTYYVHDIYGNVAYVFPPPLSHLLAHGGWHSPTPNELKAYAYHYAYDEYNRAAERTVPGGYTEYVLYDTWDRPVLRQTEKNRAASAPNAYPQEWTYVKYDKFDRPVISGKLTTSKTREQLRATLNAATTRFETLNHSGAHGYTNVAFPTAAEGTSEVHNVIYYDHYSFFKRGYFPYAPSTSLTGLYNTALGHGYNIDQTLLGSITASKTRVLGQGTFLHSILLYNDDQRLVQAQAEDLAGRTNALNVKYDDFTGEVDEMVTTYDQYSTNLQVKEGFTYDHAGRQLTHTHKTGPADEIVLARYEYNELGQLTDLKLHSPDAAKFVQSIDFRYDIRGALAKINNADLDDGEGDVFGLELSHTTGSYARLDGLISAITWRHAPPSQAGDKQQFEYKYDPLGRLARADYRNLSNTAKNDHYSVGGNPTGDIAYDMGGNIQGISRKSNGAPVDRLAYTYEPQGHKLLAVTDQAAAHKDVLFNDQNAAGNDYSYDEAGNMAMDKNKGISSIRYNDLGFTEQVVFDDGTVVEYTYTASGAKLRKLVTTPGVGSYRTDYSGHARYHDGALSYLMHPYGTVRDPIQAPTYEYHLWDHMGNTRSVIQDASGPDNPVTWIHGSETTDTIEPYYSHGTEVISSDAHSGNSHYELTYGIWSELGFIIQVPTTGTLTIEAWMEGEGGISCVVHHANGLPNQAHGTFPATGSTWKKISHAVPINHSQTGTQFIAFTPVHTSLPYGRKIWLDDIVITFTPSGGGGGFQLFASAETTDTIHPSHVDGVDIITSGPRSGEHYFKVSQGIRYFELKTASPGTLEVEAWYRGDAALNFVIYQHNDGNFSDFPIAGNTWRKASNQVTVSEPGNFNIHFSPSGDGYAVYLDDIKLTFTPSEDQYIPEVVDHTDYYPFGGRVDDATPVVLTFLATMETSEAPTEEMIFQNVDRTRVPSLAANHTEGGDRAARVFPEKPIGPSISLPVLAGDTVSLEAYAYYEHGHEKIKTIAPPLPVMAAASANAALQTLPVAGELTTAMAAHSAGAGLISMLANNEDREPAAYLNYILFDSKGKVKKKGFAATSDKANFNHEQLTMDSLIIAQDGYLFAYLSNETSSTPVFFDDLKVVHHTHIPQSQLASAQHTTLSGNLVNQYLYHSKELQNETQWYDFGYRMYDPYTTRWNAVDSLAEATIALSPYHFVYNNPVNFVDPDGRYPRDCAHGWNPDTGECFSYTGPATYGQENDPCGGIPDCYDRGGSPMKAIDYLSQNPFADTEHYDRYLREFYGYNETSYGTGRQEYVPYGTLVMAGNSVFIRHEGFHVVERNGGFRFRGMISAVQANGGDYGKSWFDEHFYFEAGGEVTFGPQATIVPLPEPPYIVPAPFVRGGGLGISVNLGSVVLGKGQVDLDKGPRVTHTVKDLAFTQGAGVAFSGASIEYQRFIQGNNSTHKVTGAILAGLIGFEWDITNNTIFVGGLPSAKWAVGIGIQGGVKGGFKFKY